MGTSKGALEQALGQVPDLAHKMPGGAQQGDAGAQQRWVAVGSQLVRERTAKSWV